MNAKLNYRNLQEFIQTLDEAGELKRITHEVDPILEVTEIADRVMKKRGAAVAALHGDLEAATPCCSKT